MDKVRRKKITSFKSYTVVRAI